MFCIGSGKNSFFSLLFDFVGFLRMMLGCSVFNSVAWFAICGGRTCKTLEKTMELLITCLNLNP